MAVPQKVVVVALNDKPEYQRILEGQPQTCGMRSGRVYLKAGEIVVQRGTNHSWSNQSGRPAVVAIATHDGA